MTFNSHDRPQWMVMLFAFLLVGSPYVLCIRTLLCDHGLLSCNRNIVQSVNIKYDMICYDWSACLQVAVDDALTVHIVESVKYLQHARAATTHTTALHRKHITEIRSVTCRMGSHGVTCHPTQVNMPFLRAGRRLTYPKGMKGWVDFGTS